jgi:hypothetical protein
MIKGDSIRHEAAKFIHDHIDNELKEIINVEQFTRFRRNDVGDDYWFVYDHRQHAEMCARLSGLLSQFLDA